MTGQDGNRPAGIVAGDLDPGGERRVFLDGSVRSRVALRTAAVGLGVYRPGWRWSLHAGSPTGGDSENHVGYVISGRLMVEDASGDAAVIEPRCAFEIAPGHDAWVVGDEPCVALDFAPLGGRPVPG